ncbi:hypothetical protein ACT4S5_09555 [Kocuria oceani]|uniref:hypothetical protein n=1 Tax=Kocuria oceani TaxID=988827 RepID=UPI004036235F
MQLDDEMIFFDARISARVPTVEVRVADGCLDPVHALVIAALVRALVEAAARTWHTGLPPAPVGFTQLRPLLWRAVRSRVGAQVMDFESGMAAVAGEAVAELLELVHPVLAEAGEDEQIRVVAATMLREGSGARAQCDACACRHDLRDVVAAALDPGGATMADRSPSRCERPAPATLGLVPLTLPLLGAPERVSVARPPWSARCRAPSLGTGRAAGHACSHGEGATTMDLQLSVLTGIDPDTRQVKLTVTGTLTEDNHRLLLRVLEQARARTAGLEELVDLTGTTSWEASAVDLLLWEIDHHDPDGALFSVGFVVPAPPANSSGAGALQGSWTVWTGADRKGEWR